MDENPMGYISNTGVDGTTSLMGPRKAFRSAKSKMLGGWIRTRSAVGIIRCIISVVFRAAFYTGSSIDPVLYVIFPYLDKKYNKNRMPLSETCIHHTAVPAEGFERRETARRSFTLPSFPARKGLPASGGILYNLFFPGSDV
jgi:hypothetical protein